MHKFGHAKSETQKNLGKFPSSILFWGSKNGKPQQKSAKHQQATIGLRQRKPEVRTQMSQTLEKQRPGGTGMDKDGQLTSGYVKNSY